MDTDATVPLSSTLGFPRKRLVISSCSIRASCLDKLGAGQGEAKRGSETKDMASVRVKAKTLSVARSLLRHVSDEFHSMAGFPPAQNVSQWNSEILAAYRGNAGADKATARAARAQANETLDYLRAVKEQRVCFYATLQLLGRALSSFTPLCRNCWFNSGR